MEPIIIAAVEGGGTSFVVAVAKVVAAEGDATTIPSILFRSEIDSSHDNPNKTLQECADFFQKHKPEQGYHALGIATFGPVGLVKSRPSTYGCILSTSPKKSWRNADLLTPLAKACQGSRPLAIKIDTDVNAPAFAEYMLVKDTLTSVAYITVGTGIGVGLVIHGQPVHGRMHPEGGHVPVQPLPNDDFGGYSWGAKSPFGGRNTVEGLASSVALTERLEKITNKKDLPRSCLADLDDDHQVWDHCANALANLCSTLLLTTSVEKIVIGGGIMKRNGLIDKIKKQTVVLLNGYLELPTKEGGEEEDLSQLITLSSYGSDIGLIGAMVLAQQAMEEEQQGLLPSTEKKSLISPFNVGVIHGIIVGVAAGVIGMSMLRRSK